MSGVDDYYALLQVDRAAEPEIIESAYRRLARKYHPDVRDEPGAAALMARLNEAYATLSDPRRRAVYDRTRVNGDARRRPSRGPAAQSPAGERITRCADLADYRHASDPLLERAATAFRSWAAEWAGAVDAAILGDARGRDQAIKAAQRCITELSECLTRLEAIMPPQPAARLNQLSAACLKLELALVRGTLGFAESADYSVLQPLAGLADRIGGLTRTIAAEAMLVDRATR